MRKKITIVSLTVALLMLLSTSAYAAPLGSKVTATIPTFPVTMNGQVVDNTYREYPFLVYNDITYFPMTYWDMRFLGVSNTWTAETGSVIITDGTTSDYKPTLTDIANKNKNVAIINTGKFKVNGKEIDNLKEEYPILSFRDVPYFPLTWSWCQEFGWNISFDTTNGLAVNTAKGATTNNNANKDTITTTKKLVASTMNVSLNNASQEIEISTVDKSIKYPTLIYEIANKDIVACEWGDYDATGYACALELIPLTTGSTTVTIYLEETGESIKLNVSSKVVEKEILTASQSTLSLGSAEESVYITVNHTEEDRIAFRIDDTNVVRCKWSKNWDGNTTTLIFTPIATGKTTVTVFLENAKVSIPINVSVNKPTAADNFSLTVKGVGEEYETWYYAGGTVYSILNSVDYTVQDIYGSNEVFIELEFIATMTRCTSKTHYIGIGYELLDDRNICVDTGTILISANQLQQPYLYKVNHTLKPGHYRIVFSDKQM